MSTLTIQGKHIMGILKKIKEYPDYRKHLPIITSGNDVFIDYIDYYFAPVDGYIADLLFIQTIIPLPGSMGNHDYTVIILDPNTVTVTYNVNYYDFDSSLVDPIDNSALDMTLFYKNIFRVMEYGCLNWGIPFRKYALRQESSLYLSGVKELNCNSDIIFTLKSDIFVPSNIRPVNAGNFSSSYDDITVLYLPLIHLNAAGAQFGIYPDEILQSFNEVLQKRKIFERPLLWLTAKERRKDLILPYSYSQTVYHVDSGKSYISLINDNTKEPGDTDAWQEIDYEHPGNNDNIPEGMDNPLQELLALFNSSFDLSTLYPE
jgi:hypothetical protein